MRVRRPRWLIIAGIIVVATVAIHPSTPDAAEGFAVGPPSLIDTDEPVS
jgi:hypothetical protein